MRRLEIPGRKYYVGISVLTKGIPQKICKQFIRSVHQSKPNMPYLLYMTEDNCVDGKYFNRNKAQNRAIELLSECCQVVICADVDLLVPEGYIDQSYDIAVNEGPFCGIMRKLHPGDDPKKPRWKKWRKYKLHERAYGPWNALTVEDWKTLGGWNEKMYSYGCDKNIWDRMQHRKMKPVRRDIGPLVHVWHSRRNTNIQKLVNKKKLRKILDGTLGEDFLQC